MAFFFAFQVRAVQGTMTIVDAAFIIIGIYFLIRGYFRGFSGEILGLLAMVGGVWLAFRLGVPLGGWFAAKSGIPPIVTVPAAFMIVWLVFAMVSVYAIEPFLRQLVEFFRLTFIDRIFGLVAGLVKTCALIAIVFLIGIMASPVTGTAWMSQTYLLRECSRYWPDIEPIVIRTGILKKPVGVLDPSKGREDLYKRKTPLKDIRDYHDNTNTQS